MQSSLNVQPFDHCGLACISDLETPRCRQLLELLEQDQAEFIRKHDRFIAPGYQWPLDPLHTWSRVWEYPYVYHHLEKWRKSLPGDHTPLVVDFGSGVTFFPFSVARLNCHVICTDIDKACQESFASAVCHISAAPGKVEFRLSLPDRLPLGDCSVDCLYCISVIEHIPDFEQSLAEVARVLKPGGLFVVTFDLDLRGDHQIGPEQYPQLLDALGRCFCRAYPVRHLHPRDMLSSDKGPYALKPPQGWAYAKYWIKNKVVNPIIGKRQAPLIAPYLTVEGLALLRRSGDDPELPIPKFCNDANRDRSGATV